MQLQVLHWCSSSNEDHKFYICTKFGGYSRSGFGDLLYFSLFFKFPFQTIIVHRGQEIELAQNIHASRGWREMHANQFWWLWPFWFWSYGSFLLAFKNGQIFPSDHVYKRKNLLGKNERIGLRKKWWKQGHRIDDANHYYFWDQSYSTLCLNDNAMLQCRIGLISEVIVIGIVNPMSLFP